MLILLASAENGLNEKGLHHGAHPAESSTSPRDGGAMVRAASAHAASSTSPRSGGSSAPSPFPRFPSGTNINPMQQEHEARVEALQVRIAFIWVILKVLWTSSARDLGAQLHGCRRRPPDVPAPRPSPAPWPPRLRDPGGGCGGSGGGSGHLETDQHAQHSHQLVHG